MKKTAKASGSNASFKSVFPRKKRKDGAFEEDSNSSISSETGNITESDSIDMEKKCLVEKTSFDFGDGGALAGGDPNQTSTGSKVKMMKALNKPLGKINFLVSGNNNNVLSDAPLDLPLPLRNVVNVSIRKFFALDIGLNKISGKSSQKKLMTRCAVVCFESAESLDAVMGTTLVLKSTHLHWSYLVSAICAKYGKLDVDKSKLAAIYAKCSAPVAHPVLFGGVLWAKIMKPTLQMSLVLNNRFATLECSLASLAECVNKLAKRLDTLRPMVSQLSPGRQPLVIPSLQNQEVNIVMSESSGVDTSGGTVVRTAVFYSSIILKMEETLRNLSIMVMSLLAKMDNANSQEDVVQWHRELDNLVSIVTETKLRSSVKPWIANKFEDGFLGAGVAVIMNVCLAHYVSKIEEVLGRVVSVRLLFKDKLSVTFLELYASASADAKFGQALEVNSLIAKAVNSSTFVVLSGDFNENGSEKNASFKFCLNLGLVNSFAGHSLVKAPIWSNSRGVKKTIDYIFISESLSSAVTGQGISSVSDFFDTDYKTITVSIGLGELLDVCLNSLCKQANRDCWKFRIKDVDNAKWSYFRKHFSNRILEVEKEFRNASIFLDLDQMWLLLERVMVGSANKVFFRHWFSEFQCSRNKQSSKFFGLEMLVAKIVRLLSSGDISGLGCLLKKWSILDVDKAFVVLALIQDDKKLFIILKHLSLVRKGYQKSKMYKLWLGKEASVREAIVKCMDKFCSDKGGMIRSVLDCSFCKVVLDHLVVDNSLVLEPKKVKVSVDNIMEGWTKKRAVPMVLPDLWARQYALLDYVQNDVFAEVMCEIGLNELLSVVKGLPDGKAASVGLPFEAVEHMLSCWWGAYFMEKSVDFNDSKTTAWKIFSKILSDCILLACSKFGILYGNNFLVLKGTSTQSPIFAIGLVVEDAIEKNKEI
ncbi:hypothetical protein G9A89_006709 [Geosiphon pyriformis]|nr:hypothetical protein G9A89_006709 [Geosiphon pyriformis]